MANFRLDQPSTHVSFIKNPPFARNCMIIILFQHLSQNAHLILNVRLTLHASKRNAKTLVSQQFVG